VAAKGEKGTCEFSYVEIDLEQSSSCIVKVMKPIEVAGGLLCFVAFFFGHKLCQTGRPDDVQGIWNMILISWRKQSTVKGSGRTHVGGISRWNHINLL